MTSEAAPDPGEIPSMPVRDIAHGTLVATPEAVTGVESNDLRII